MNYKIWGMSPLAIHSNDHTVNDGIPVSDNDYVAIATTTMVKSYINVSKS